MRFFVTRTSDYGDEDRPCKEAFQVTVPSYDRRTTKTFEEFRQKLGESFMAKGTEHEVTPTGIRRRMGDEQAWAVDLDSLEDLCAFFKKYGDLVITDRWGGKQEGDDPMIEIYDGYRE